MTANDRWKAPGNCRIPDPDRPKPDFDDRRERDGGRAQKSHDCDEKGEGGKEKGEGGKEMFRRPNVAGDGRD
jgi:hypothetical protein